MQQIKGSNKKYKDQKENTKTLSGQITTTSWRHGQNGQKLEKSLFFPMKYLVVRSAPIRMIQ